MKERESKVYIFFIILIVLTVISSEHNLFIHANDVQVVKKTDPLLEKIKTAAPTYHEEPDNAYIDRVWEKTPGRNGRKVNIEESYEKMKEVGQFKEDLLVFDEIPPEISLKDLTAAPIYRGHPDKNMIALMINVSWGEEHVPSILKTLRKENVKATFYIEGKWAKEHKELVKMIMEENHLIGNHAYNHPDMAKISQQEMKEQIVKTNDILKAITGEQPRWFAPPSGSFNDQVVEIAYEENMETILWTVDTIDWQKPSVSVMINRVMENIHPGATILMHPTEVIAEGLESLIIDLEKQGYHLGTIESLLSEKRG